MATQIIVVLFLNVIISLIGTLAYSVRIVGIRTGKIAVSFSLFSIMVLVSRTAMTFQIPLLTKYVESNKNGAEILNIFFLIIIISGFSTIIGAFLIPSFQRIFTGYVTNFSVQRSIPKLLVHSFSKIGTSHFKEYVKIPKKENITKLNIRKLPMNIIVWNAVAVAVLTAGVLAPIYAGSIEPELRATCFSLSAIINGFATIILTIFIDPHLSILTDDVVSNRYSESNFRRVIVGMVASKIAGTFLSLLILIPAAYLIILTAKII